MIFALDQLMLNLLIAAASSTVTPPQPLSPVDSLITASDYPAGAIERDVTGRVEFRLRINRTGIPDGCVVSQTSGSRVLDDATCDLMLARARFKPALAANGDPMRGDYSARVTWNIDQRPEPLTNEVIRVRSEILDGKVTSCTADPSDVSAQFGGCATFGDPRMLHHLVGKPLTDFTWIEMRVVKHASTQPPIIDIVPVGAIKNVIAQSTMVVTPGGAIGACSNDEATKVEGRTLDLCAVARGDTAFNFVPAAGAEPRQLTIIMETVTKAR